MFAVIKTGGKQYRVAENDVIKIEKLAGEAGEAVAFERVLMVSGDGEPVVGAPFVEGATVTGEVVDQGRAAKIIVFKKKRRKKYRRTAGHRQYQTDVRITGILTGGAKPKTVVKTAAKAVAKSKVEKAAPKEDKPAPKAAKAEAAPKASKAKTADALFAAPDGPADDLKKIAGVGPVLEKKLNALGITKYAQVAAFTARDIAQVDEKLSFKGRIEREDWISQAKDLARG